MGKLEEYLQQYYGKDLSNFRGDLQEIIYMLHFIDSDTITKAQIRNACGLLKELGEVVGEGH